MHSTGDVGHRQQRRTRSPASAGVTARSRTHVLRYRFWVMRLRCSLPARRGPCSTYMMYMYVHGEGECGSRMQLRRTSSWQHVENVQQGWIFFLTVDLDCDLHHDLTEELPCGRQGCSLPPHARAQAVVVVVVAVVVDVVVCVRILSPACPSLLPQNQTTRHRGHLAAKHCLHAHLRGQAVQA